MRVALVAPFGLRPKGTTSARVLPIGRVLAAQGADVRVIIPPWDDQQRAGERWTEAGVEVVHTGLAPGPLQRLVVILDMLQAIRSFQPDVVHAFKPIGYSGAIANRLAGRPGRRPLVVVDADDFEGPAGWAGRRGLGLAGRLRGAQERRTLRAAPLITVASSWLIDFVGSLGVAPDRILRLPNGHAVQVSGSKLRVPRSADVPSSELRVSSSAGGSDPAPDTRNPQLVWYTRFTEAAPDRASRVLAPLLRVHPELVLTVLGDELAPGDRGALEGALVREGVGPRVRWLGYEQATSEEYLLRAGPTAIAVYLMDDDAVNRARCPSKVPQLMAYGVPIVAEAVGEIPRYLAGFEQCLAAPGNEVAYRERVEALLADRSTRSSLGRKLQGAADQWRWDNLAAGLLPWYEYALRGADKR